MSQYNNETDGSSPDRLQPAPLCVFYFSHPFSVRDVAEEASRDGRGHPRGIAKSLSRRGQDGPSRASQPCRCKTRSWGYHRRSLRKPAPHPTTQLLLPGRAGVRRSPPSLAEVLQTVREVWAPPRSLSLERPPSNRPMGTGARAGRLRPGLPHRRYSVPETVMRKYVLTKARSESSDSGVATVPVPTPDGVSGSEGARRRATSRWSNGGGSGSDRGPPSPRRRAPASHGGSLTALTRIAPGVEPNLLRTLHANERTHGFEPSRTSRGLHPEVTPSHADVSTQLSKTPVLTINTVSDSSGADSPKVQAQNGKTQYLPVNVVHRATPPPPRQFSKSSGPSLSSQSSALSESTSGRVSGSSETAETCSVTPATDLSFSTPTDCCTTPPVSESCSLTTSDSRATTSSMTIDQPVSDHTNSTQDVTLSVPSTHEHTPFSNPLTEGEITSGASSAVQDQYNTDHIAFMDDKEESLPNRRSSLILAMAIVSVREQAEEKSQSETRFCGPSDAPPSQYINMDDVDTNQDSIKNDREENECQLCNYEPDDVKNGGDKQKEPHLVNRLQDGAPDEDTRFETNKTKPNKTLFLEQTDTSLLIPTTPEIEIRHVKTFQVISPNILSVKRNDKCAGTLPTAPPEPNISDTSEVIQEQKVHKLGAEEPQVEVKHLLTGPDVYAPYRWNQQTEEDRQIRQTHQRQRFWIHRRLVSATTLPPTAPTQDPISACAGSSYRRTQEEQLVIPRYSALPRSLSMLVNTSSGDCSSNSDSETLSLADSLEDGQSFSKTGGSKYDNKPVRGDIVKLLPEGNTQWQHKRIHVATPRGKGKAFFVSISQGNYDDQEDQQLSRSMPDKLKDKLSQRQRQMQLKKQKRQESDSTKNGNSPTSPVSPTPENRPSSRPETPQKKSQQSVSTQTVQEPKVQIPQQSNAVEEPSTDNIVVIKEPIPTVTITNHDQDGAPETNPEHILRPITPLHSDKISDTTLVKQPVDNTEERKPLKSSIPIKKSPISLRKLTPPVMSPTILQNLNQKPSQLPIRRPIRSIQQSPPVRRSANLLGNRFHQQFEVIPEERSGSLESSAEDQGRVRRASLPIGSSKHYCGIVDRSEQSHLYSVKNKSKPNSVANDDTSSNNDDNIPDGISARCGQAKSSRPLVRRPGRQSKTARAPRERPKERDDSTSTYKGKAALAPHEEDKDLLSLSKGWINFYLLKNSRGTPEDSTAEDASTNISEKDERVRRRPGPPIRTVTVVGAEEDRLRQFSVHTRNGTALPELKSNVSSRRASLAESEPSTLYLQLPSPRLSMPGLLEGSGELACSESSSVSTSSDSEPDRMPSPALLPVRWAGRQSRRGPRQRSRSHGPGVATSGSGWTVTVAGSNACPQQTPDLEMRLSFPACARRPPASQSDSGLGEDNNGNHTEVRAQQQQPEHFLPPAHRWTLTVKNQSQEASDKTQEIPKTGKRPFQCLPDLGCHPGQNNNSKKAIKSTQPSHPVTSVTEEDMRNMTAQRRLSIIWPKVHKIIESKVIIRKISGQFSHEVNSVSQLLENEEGNMVLQQGLAVTGSAITPEKKPRVPTMSERDLTRGHTARR